MYGAHISLKIGNRQTVWLLVTNAETSSHIDILDVDTRFLEIILKLVDFFAQWNKSGDIGYLGSDMEMQTYEFQIFSVLK